MKKLVAVLLVLAMMVAVTAAFAEAVNSKTAGDIAGTGNVVVKGGNEDDGIVITIVDPDEGLTELFAEIVASGKLADILPEDVLKGIPEGFDDEEALAEHLKEMIAITATGKADGVESFTFGLKLETPYEEDQELCVLFGLPEGGWMMKDAIVKDGEVTITMVKEEIEKILNKGIIAVLVLNK